MKIVVLDGYTENPGDLSWEGFEAFGEITVYPRTIAKTQEDTDALILERSKGAQVLLTNKTPLRASVLKSLAPTLGYIGVLATGFNVVDVETARSLKIPVCNIPSYGTQAVAQHTMALLLEICNRVGEHAQSVKDGEWSRCPDFCYWKNPLTELAGKTLGIIGYGRIGQAMAQLGAAFGMRVLAFDAFAQASPPAQIVTLATLLKESDVISLHCPLTADTHHILNEQTLSETKKGVIILNTSRGPLIKEEALAQALHSGQVGGAGLDVVCTEPILPDNPLISAPNCLITPHIAWASRESRQRLMDYAVQNLQAFLEGTPQNVVNS